MEDLFGPGDFLLTFPVWVPIHPTAEDKAFILIVGLAGEKSCPLFTDEMLAKDFWKSDPGWGHYLLVPLANHEEFVGVLDLLRCKGFTHVVFNRPDAGRPEFHSPIDRLRAHLQQGPGEQGTGENPEGAA